MAATCAICVDTFNKSTRKPVTCMFCQFQSCTSCAARCILDAQDPECVSCHKPWSYDFIVSSFSKKFVTEDLKKHRRQILYERELSLLPATQAFLEEQKAEEIRRKKIDQLHLDLREAKVAAERVKPSRNLKINKMRQELREILASPLRLSMAKREKILKTDIAKLTETLKPAYAAAKERLNEIKFELHKLVMVGAPDHPDNAPERVVFVRACPASECRGFLSTQWKCGLCESRVCSDCHEIKKPDTEHVCKESDVETVKLLSKDSKPCPCCGALSIKLSGCNQVYCIKCQNAWNWQTGRIDRGRIHAPDYYAMLDRVRGNGRVHGDVACGGMPHAHQFLFGVRVNSLDPQNLQGYNLIAYQRLLVHMYEVDGAKIRPDRMRDNQDLRIKFLLNEITRQQFEKTLHMREKSNRKKDDTYQVISTLFDVASEIYRNIMVTADTSEIERLISELKSLIAYANDGFAKISAKYNSKVVMMAPALIKAGAQK